MLGFIIIWIIGCQLDMITAEINVCTKVYNDVDYQQCGQNNNRTVKRECCPGWYDPAQGLNCHKAFGYFNVAATCDNEMWFYVDGKLIIHDTQWANVNSVRIPDPCRIVVIKCFDYGVPGGIKAVLYGDPTIRTDSSWKCNYWVNGAILWNFNDQSWPNAVTKTHRNWGNNPLQLSSISWIWTPFHAMGVGCRRKIVPVCPSIRHCQHVTCTNKYDQLCARCEGEHGGEVGDKAFVPTRDKLQCHKMCSWRLDSSRCYPGTCSPVNADQFRCQCSPGFTGHHCQTIIEESAIHYNELRLEDSNREYVEAPGDIQSSNQQPAVWTNIINPAIMKYKFTTDFQLKNPPCRPSYVKEFKVGIVSGDATLRYTTCCEVRNVTYNETEKQTTDNILKQSTTTEAPDKQTEKQTTDNILKQSTTTEVPDEHTLLITEVKKTCFISNNELNPSLKIEDCENTLSNFTDIKPPFKHNDSLELIFNVKNGGFIRIENKDTGSQQQFTYTGVTTTRSITLRFDIIKPYHCFPESDCTLVMLSDTDGTKNVNYNLSWDGWYDDDSLISYYECTVFELKLKLKELEEGQKIIDKQTNLTSSVLKFTTPAIYSLIFTAVDNAGNHKSARRIIIFDPSSKITTTHNSHLRVVTAEVATSYKWQQTLADVLISWKNRYINTVHHTGGYLSKVKNYHGVDPEYDDNDGIRTTKAVKNIQGIIKYESYFKVDPKGGSTIEHPLDSNFTNTQNIEQEVTLKPLLNDGDTLQYFIRAYDIMTNYKEESVTVYFDSSPPLIEHLWLTKGDQLNIAVHGFEDFSKMIMEWDAYDVHSGLEAVEWILYDNYTGASILHGKESISPQGEAQTKDLCEKKYNKYARGPDCYCTPAVGCYHKHFQIHLKVSTIEGEGLIHNMSKGTHDYDYFIEINVVNNAKLKSLLTYQITIDTSPPHEGNVHDGKTDHPEVDFQEDLQLFAHWDGFFDKESGVRFYQYGFGPACLTADQFNYDLLKTQGINETTLTFTTWEAPSTGKFYITVVAYNQAFEPSRPVCSDGVTIDTTKPVVSEIYVDGVAIESGLIKKDNQVYFVNTNRQIYQIPNPDSQCIIKATNASDILLYPKERFPEENFHGKDMCKEKPLQPDFLIKSYLSKHSHIYVNWTGIDNESGIYDYKFGLASDRDSSAAPDLFPFISTNHHPWYKGHHPELNDGTEFFLCIKSINKAGLSTIQVLGPIIVHTTAPVFKGDVNVFIKDRYLVANWASASVKDLERTRISYTAALGTSPGGQEVQHFLPLKTGSSCQSADPPSCTVFPIDDLVWNLHHKYSYYVSLKLVNIVGLHTVAVSKPYIHKNRIPAKGVVFDVIPEEETNSFLISKMEDADFQTSTNTLTVRWFGYESEDLQEDVNYEVNLKAESGDDVIKSVKVGSKTRYTFLGLKLEVFKKYIVNVKASIDGGPPVESSSDGITIIKDRVDLTDSSLAYDGCTGKQVYSQWKPNHYNKQQNISSVNCSQDIQYQSSTSSYTAQWELSSDYKQMYSDVKWTLQLRFDDADIWTDVKHKDMLTYHQSLTETVDFETCKSYRSKIRFCASNICSTPIYTDGVTILDPPNTPEISVQVLSDSQFHISLKFKPSPEESLCSTSKIIDRLEWSITDNAHDTHLLTRWTEVEDVDMLDNNILNVTLLEDLDFSKCRRLSIKIFNKAELSSTVSSEIKNCSAQERKLIVPNVVIDAYNLQTNQETHKAQGVHLDKNSIWSLPDIDYTPHDDIISAVWPTLRLVNYTWALMDQLIPISSQEFIIDPCSHPNKIQCGQTDDEYINIKPTKTLEDGKRYYVCIHAKARNTSHEKWEEYLPAESSCSDGVTIDLTPPTAGRVWIETGTKTQYQTSSNTLRVYWDSFMDVEEEAQAVHPSGILYYNIKIGSSIGGSNIITKVPVGLVNHKIFHNLSLQNGHNYFASIEAVDFVGKRTSVDSSGIIIDTTPPIASASSITFPSSYLTSDDLISACWKEAVSDKESGIKTYIWSIGTRAGHQDVMEAVQTLSDCGEVKLSIKLQDGFTYYINLQAINGAGLVSTLVYKHIIADNSPPVAGHVLDVSKDIDQIDQDYFTQHIDPIVKWQAFHDPHSSIKHYKVQLGSCKGCDDIFTQAESGTLQDFTFRHAKLIPGIKYYAMVTACNHADLCSSVSSDGFIVDVTTPIPGNVLDGTKDTDIDFQASRTYIGAKWYGFKDSESGIERYEWRAGTTVGGDDILQSQVLPVVEIIYKSNLPDKRVLPVGVHIFITIRAYNKAGLYSEVSSNGFIIDITKPVSTQPALSQTLASIYQSTSISRTGFKVHWSYKDEESNIERQYISLAPHIMGDFNSSATEIPGVLKEYTFSNLDLHDGSKYRVKVIGCNLAGLCQSAMTNDILVDSTPPTRGTFAIKTNHAANLKRHSERWIKWTATSVTVSWLGFSDLHTDITHYLISLGSEPFFTDFNKEGILTKFSHKDGANFKDEGVIQTQTLQTSQKLHHGMFLYIAIWAVNQVGLKSQPIHAQFQLVHADYQTDDQGSLVRRCNPYNCEGHCVCSVQDKTCSLSSGCVPILTDNQNTLIEVRDIVDLSTDNFIQSYYTSSNTFLSARWKLVKNQGMKPLRFEVGVGESNKNQPVGIFDVSTERHWFDVGQNMEVTVAIPRDKKLHENIFYSVFVRVWYSETVYSVFKSPGITPVTLPPKLRNFAGAGIKELTSSSYNTDIDYQTVRDRIIVGWKNKFIGGIHGLHHFNTYISTHPLGHNIHNEAYDIPSNKTTYTVNSLKLKEDKTYYSTVLAYTKAGLVSWSTSDGITIDYTPPASGIIHDGHDIHDADYQASLSLLTASWYGFSDKDSGIVKYYWCAGKNKDDTTCDVHPWTDVGLKIKINVSSSAHVYTGEKVYHKVFAVDGSGLNSTVSKSNGIIVDNTPPSTNDVEYVSDNLISNPSFENLLTSDTDASCNSGMPQHWTTDSLSCVRAVSSHGPVANDADVHLKVSGQIKQRLKGLKQNTEYHIIVHVGYPHDVQSDHHPVEGFVRLGKQVNTFKLNPDKCAGTVCQTKSVIYWYRFIYSLHPTKAIEDLIIGTTRNDMVLALDNIQLHEVNYVPVNDKNADIHHIHSHSLFRPYWSSVHINWHFTDNESPIVDYQWALGTVMGGTQIKEFTSSGRHNHVTISNLQLIHNTQLYFTVKATNKAGLSTVSRFNNIIVDMTPPVVIEINDGLRNDIDYQLTNLISVNWKIEDLQSDIDYCQWAIGSTPGGTDIQQFSSYSGEETSASVEINKNFVNMSVTVYSTIRCFNKAGIHVTAITDGVKLIPNITHSVESETIVQKQPSTQYTPTDRCYPLSNSLKLHWIPQNQIRSQAAMVHLESDKVNIEKLIPLTDISYNGARLCSFKFNSDTNYNVSISTINVMSRVDSIRKQRFYTGPDSPEIKEGGTAKIAKSVDGKTMVISWTSLFLSQWKDLVYEVSLSTTPGGSDVLQWQETTKTFITVELMQSDEQLKLYLSLNAVDPCGYFTHYNQIITVV